MAISGGPDIVDSGLVLALDVANAKSFRGEPTTNLVPSPYNYNSYAYVSGPVDTSVLDENGSTITAKRYTITSAINTARAAIRPESLTTATSYTFSVKWKYNGTNTASPGFSLDASKGNPEGGTNNNTIASQSTQTTSLGNGWYRSVYIFSFSAVPTAKCILTFGIVTGADTLYVNQTFDVYEAQFEQKAYDTPFVNGTRGTTVATGGGWADLTGNSNHGTLVNGPTYNNANGGSIVFDGVDDYIQLPSTSHPTGNCSLELILKHSFTSFVGSKYFLYGASGTAFTVYFRGDWAGNLLYFLRRTNGSSYYGDSAWGFTTGIYQPVPANELMHLVFTHNASDGQFRVYKNGILIRTVDGNRDGATGLSSGYGGLNTTQQTHYIGGTPSSNLPMNLYNFKFYNTVLSAQEILQNFNATRSRFGL